MRSEIVRSATRLLGIRDSFDSRSFLGHVLRVNDLLPDKTAYADLAPSAFRNRMRSGSRSKAESRAMPGDIVFFKCPGRCGPTAGDPITAGVVVRVYSSRIEFVCYVDSVVRMCHHGGKKPRHASIEVGELLDVVSVASRPP